MPAKSDAIPTPRVDDAERIERTSEILRSIADVKRLKMLHLLAQGELCVCEIMDALGISQALASHHLRVLREAGLVRDRRDARWVYYSLDTSRLGEVARFLATLTATPARGERTPPKRCSIQDARRGH